MLTRKEVARRWRDCNRQDFLPAAPDPDEEETCRTNILDLLSKIHTLGGIADLSFEVVESNYSVSRSVSRREDLSLTMPRTLRSSWSVTHSSGDGRHVFWDTKELRP